MAQQNLNNDNAFQSNTIQQLTSGYRINSSGDDAAGLAIANTINAGVAQLNQGVMNANNAVSQLQIIDGGLSNISTILNRMNTLATESASSTFSGNRATVNQEYSSLISEINRQSSNIGLNSGGNYNTNLSVFIGGASASANASVNLNLAGTNSAVDATSLGLSTSNVLNGGVDITGGTANTTRLDAPGALFLAAGSQSFTFNTYVNGYAQTVTAQVSDTSATSTGITETQVLSQLNTQLNTYGLSASVDSNGLLQFSGSTPWTLKATTAATAGNAIATAGGKANNTSNYIVTTGAAGADAAFASTPETLTFQTSTGTAAVTLAGTANLAQTINQINQSTASLGVYAVEGSAQTGIQFQGSNSFSIYDAVGGGVFTAAGNNTSTAPTTGAGSNASAALTQISAAIAQLGLVQGKIGAGENTLNYALNLANSQITSYSAEESQIKDANVAQEAANLTKAQVLTQTSVAALAQANSQPQSILKLLQ